MTEEIEVPATGAPAPASRKTRTAEQAMKATVIKSVAVSVPLMIAVFVGLIALAVHNQQPDWNAYIGIGVGIGVVAGVFFGMLIGFTLTSHSFE